MTDTSSLSADTRQTPMAPIADEIDRFADDLRAFRTNVETKMADQSARLDALDRNGLARPALERAAEQATPHSKAMAAYLRTGETHALGALELEGKALATTGDGGYLVDPRTADTIATTLKGASTIRSIASVVTVDAGAYDVLVDHGDFSAAWQAEASAVTETDTPSIARISIPLHELSALPKTSQRLLDDSAFDLEAWLADRISDRFARSENAAFITGDGDNKPTGFLNYSAVTNGSWQWGNLGYTPTGVDNGFPTENAADVLIELVYSLGARYRRNARFVMNSTTAGLVRRFKDAEGRYLWTETMIDGQPPRLFGYPVMIVEDMPPITSGSLSIAFGDFQAGYCVAERPDLRILRDPYSAKPNVLFYATKRVGGDVIDFAAIKVLKFSAT